MAALTLTPALLMLVVVLVAWVTERDRLATRAEQNMAVLTELIAAGQQQLVEGSAQLLKAIGSAPALTSGDVQQCNQYLARLNEANPGYANIGMINPAGRLTCRALSVAGEVDLSDRVYFTRAMRDPQLAIGEYIIGRSTGVRTINFGQQVRGDDGVVKGVAFVAVDLRRLDEKLRAISLPAGIEVQVLDASGTVLAGTSGVPPGTRVDDPARRTMIVAGQSGVVQSPPGARPVHTVLRRIDVSGAPGLYVMVSAAHDLVLAPAMRSLRQQLSILAVLGLLSAIGAWLVADRLLARPLQRLQDAVDVARRQEDAEPIRLARSPVRELAVLQLGLRRTWQSVRRRRLQRDQALEEANAAKQGMVEILDRMSEGFLVVDTMWRITYLNQRAIDMLQKGRGDLTGENLWALFPDDPGDPVRLGCERALSRGKPWDFERYYPSWARWFEMRMFTSPDGIGIFLHDNTERRQTLEALREREARYREIFEFNPHVMWVYDVKTLRFLAVNQAAVARYGYTAEEFRAMSIADIRPEEDIAELIEFLGTPRPPAALGESRIWRHRRKDGTVFLVEVITRPITYDERDARLVLVTDSTERLVVDSRLRRTQARLEQELATRSRDLDLAGKVLESFSYLVSHDLRSPLQVIDGFARELSTRHAQSLDEQGRHFVARIRASTQRIGQLIDAMLLLSRVTRAPIEPARVDLTLLAQSAIDELRAAHADREVSVEVQSQMVCSGDPALIRQAVTCLIDNAWKFSSHRPDAWIRIGQKVSEDAREIVYFVSDNGAGFDMEYADKLFVAFQRLHSVAEFPGVGVGLAIAHRIISRHGGRIWAESDGATGATFHFTIGRPH
jgi:PAS domain S-box-containing protein